MALVAVLFVAAPASAAEALPQDEYGLAFTASASQDGVKLAWRLESERGVAGYNLYRSESADGLLIRVNPFLLLALGASQDQSAYNFTDFLVQPGTRYWYRLEVVLWDGFGVLYGPANALTGSATDGVSPSIAETSTTAARVVNYDPWTRLVNLALADGGLALAGAAVVAPVAAEVLPPAPPAAAEPVRFVLPAPAAAGEEPEQEIKLEPMEEQGRYLLVVNTPAMQFEQTADGSRTLSMAGYQTPVRADAAPVPVRAVLLPVPAGGAASLKILKWKVAETRHAADLVPAAPRVEASARAEAPVLVEPRATAPVRAGLARSKSAAQERFSTRADAGSSSGASEEEVWTPQDTLVLGHKVVLENKRWIQLVIRPVQSSARGQRLRRLTRITAVLEVALGQDVSAPALPALPDGPEAIQSWLAGTETLKIRVAETGPVRLTGADLAAAGFPTSGDPRLLRLFREGREVSMQVTGEQDGVLNPTDELRFWAKGRKTAFSDEETYWLAVSAVPGTRIGSDTVAPHSVPQEASQVRRNDRKEKDLRFFNKPLNNMSRDDYWSWTLVASVGYQPASWSDTFQVKSPASQPELSVRYRLYGGMNLEWMNPDHHVVVRLNGVQIAEHWFDGYTGVEREVWLPDGLLQSGDNTFSVELPGDSGYTYDYVYLDWYRVSYQSKVTGDAVTVWAGNPEGADRVVGFTEPPVDVWDVSYPERPIVLNDWKMEQGVQGQDLVLENPWFFVPRNFAAITASGWSKPAGLELNSPSRLRGSDRVDWIAIAPAELVPAAERLAAHRRSLGLAARVVVLSDVYDEFGWGRPSDQAIKDFVGYAQVQWAGPRYLLLAADATYDPKNIAGDNKGAYIPTHLLPVENGVTASDSWFAANGPDGVTPSLCVGRLPVGTLEQALAVVDKIIGYETAAGGQPWQTRALWAADDSNGGIFQTGATDMTAKLPAGMTVNRIDLAYAQIAAQRTAITGAINDGVLIAGYTGHGSVSRWYQYDALTTKVIPALANGDRLPFVLQTASMVGYFHDPRMACVSETFLTQATGGAVAVWGSTHSCRYEPQRFMNIELVRLIFQDGLDLGTATTRAKAYVAALGPTSGNPGWYQDVVNTYVLFGDPATRLHTPATN